jgi:hypothetical protein
VLLGLSLGLFGVGCETAPAPTSASASASESSNLVATATPARVITATTNTAATAGAGRGLRVDLRDKPQHVRGLQRQPDGTYRNVCLDTPASLRPAGSDGAGGRK